MLKQSKIQLARSWDYIKHDKSVAAGKRR